MERTVKRRRKNFAMILGSLSACLFACLSVALTSRAQQPKVPRRNFEVHNIGALDALIRIGETYNQPMGVVTSEQMLATTEVSAQVTDATSEDAIAALMSRLPAYDWRKSGGVIIVEPRSIPLVTKAMLQTVIPRFAVKNASADHLSALLWWELQRKVDPANATQGSFGISHDPHVIDSVDLTNATVGEILDDIVRKRRSAAWIVLPAIAYIKGAPRDNLWNIVSYSDPPRPLSELCCLNPEGFQVSQR